MHRKIKLFLILLSLNHVTRYNFFLILYFLAVRFTDFFSSVNVQACAVATAVTTVTKSAWSRCPRTAAVSSRLPSRHLPDIKAWPLSNRPALKTPLLPPVSITPWFSEKLD